MTVAAIPNRPGGTDHPRAISLLIADFDALLTFLNGGNIDPNNLSSTLHNAKVGLTDTGATRRGQATVATSQSCTTNVIQDLTTDGPSVAVTVPTNGLVGVFAQVDLSATGGATPTVSLDESGSNIGDLINSAAAGPTTLYSTGGALQGSLATRGFARWIEFPPVSTGARTFKLRYRNASGVGTATFANRKIWVVTWDPT